ncbi:helix-turn-helix domain-containing protein [Cellulomonas soli]|uniref:helix-turn-helix domain-containing protein n=1 Tax=Cellulomonas soli TaxID=931535 RepID=UPI003F831596
MSTATDAITPDLTVPEVAAVLRESAWTVRQLIRRGDLAAYRVGRGSRGALRVEHTALRAFKDARSTTPRN